jgi:hypothetical protein
MTDSRTRWLLILSPFLLSLLALGMAYVIPPVGLALMFLAALGVIAGTDAVAGNETSRVNRALLKLVYFGFASLTVFSFGWAVAIAYRGGG